MRVIILTYYGSEKPIIADNLNPDRISKLTLDEIKDIKIIRGKRKYPAREFFKIEEEEDKKTDGIKVVLEEGNRTIKWLGSGMTYGEIIVNGSVGEHLGSRMVAGKITVNGDCGSWAGAELKGGTIAVNGNAGDFIGSNYIGNKIGMTGGIIEVAGSTGDFTGSRLSGGEIHIKMDCGAFAGYRMRKGEITIRGNYGKHLGARMKGGTIRVLRPPTEKLIGFQREQDEKNIIFNGDLTENGKGKIIIKIRQHD